MVKIIIIGGMAAGCKAAARLARLSDNYSITVIERKPFVSFGSCGLPYYAAGEIDNLFDLSKTAYGTQRDEKYFLDVKGVEVLTNTEVSEIKTDNSEVKCFNIKSGKHFSLNYDKLIIAIGAKAIKPNFSFPESPRISSFHSPFDAKNFKEFAQKGKIGKAIIIGGGFIGCELTEAMTSLWGIETELIEKENSLLTKFLDPEFSRIVEKKIGDNDVKIHLSSEVEKIKLNEEQLPTVYLKNESQITADYVFYNLGVKPDSSLAKKCGIDTGKYDGIVVNEKMQTNFENIFASGDCVEVNNVVSGKTDYFSFGSLANRMGKIAADNIAGRDNQFKGVVGNVSLKIFNTIVCSVGLTEQIAFRCGIQTGSVIGTWADRPDYYPEYKNLFGKLVYEKSSLRLLGIQLIGDGEVTRYADIFSELLFNNKAVYDLQDVEHGYTPAHSSPISPLNFLGYMALNQEVDGMINTNPLDLELFNGTIIDVREDSERAESYTIDSSVHIPLTSLRKRTDEFPKDQKLLFVCEKGPRSYEAARIFKNKEFKNVSYLGGGLIMLKEFYKETNELVG